MLPLLLDENLPLRVAALLKTYGFDAETVANLHARGAAEEEVLDLAVRTDRVLLTRDLDFSDILRFPLGSHCGIVVLRMPNSTSLEDMAITLRNRLESLSRADVAGNLFVITPNLMRMRIQQPDSE